MLSKILSIVFHAVNVATPWDCEVLTVIQQISIRCTSYYYRHFTQKRHLVFEKS